MEFGEGQTEGKTAGFREVAKAERNMKPQGSNGEEHEAYTEKGTRLAREEEDGSSGLAPDIHPSI